MLRVDAKDRSAIEALSLLKSAILDVIMKTFVRELHDDDVRKKTIRELIAADRSLRRLCTMTENANRSKREFRKLMKKENKSRKLKFYKEMIQRIMSKEKIESMLASFRAESSDI
jgi:seryl-tRNA synthetase